jgi:hypothetical protein
VKILALRPPTIPFHRRPQFFKRTRKPAPLTSIQPEGRSPFYLQRLLQIATDEPIQTEHA